MQRRAWSACVTAGVWKLPMGEASGGKSPLEILLPQKSLGISLEPKLARGYMQQCGPSAQRLWGSTWETPTLNGVPCPERLLRAGAAREHGSWEKQVPVPAHLHPCGNGQIETVAIHTPSGGCFEAWGFISGQLAGASYTAHSPCRLIVSATHRASAPTAPLGQTPLLQPLQWRKDPLLPPDRAFLLQPAWGLLNRRRKTHCDFKQTQRTYRIWRETIFSSAAQSPH